MNCPLNDGVIFDYNDCQDCEHCMDCYIKIRSEDASNKFWKEMEYGVGDNFPTLKFPFELNDYKRKNPNKITQSELDDFRLDLFKLHSFKEWEDKN
jgi:hypothetical protein